MNPAERFTHLSYRDENIRRMKEVSRYYVGRIIELPSGATHQFRQEDKDRAERTLENLRG